MNARALKYTPADYLELCHFLYREAELLDTRDWDSWGALFSPEGVYWVPAAHGQTEGSQHVSLIHETSLLRAIRLQRLKNADAISLQGSPRASHLLSNVAIVDWDVSRGRCCVRSKFVTAQYASWGTTSFHGSYLHELIREGADDWRIALKRVDLVNVDGPLGDVLIIL